MILQDFVRESLLQIKAGVREAHREDMNVGMEIEALSNQTYAVTTKDKQAGVMIEFDIAVTVTERTGKEGGAAISVVSVFNGGAKASASLETSSVTRIKFAVPVIYGAD